MNKKGIQKIVKLLSCASITMVLIFMLTAMNVSGATITVPDNYATIQQAINAANPGDTIQVRAGTYYEHLTISKSLILQGEEKTTTIIDGSGSGNIISLPGTDNVIISDFTIKNGNYGIFFTSQATYNTVKNVVVTNNFHGINNHDQGNHHNTFQNIEAYDNTNAAISAYAGSDYLKVLDSHIYNNVAGCGVQIGWSNYWSIENSIINSNGCGINIDTARYGTVKNNDIYSNTNGGGTAPGIGFGGWGPYYNVIVGNKIHSNDWGIVFGCQARYNTIKENHINDNSVGVYNTKNGGYPNYANTFYYNDFKGNTINAKNDEDRGEYTNTWDNGYPSGGNYWDDYTGSDLNSGAGQNVPGSDGIGDTPKVINVLDTDRYPLMRPWNTHAPIVNAGPDQSVNEGDTVTFSGSFTDSDPGDTHTISISWDFGDSSASVTGTLTPTHVYADNGPYTVTLTITDNNGGVGTDTLIVTVNNIAPSATLNAPDTVNEGSAISLSLTDPSDPSGADTAAGFLYAFDCGTGYGAYSSESTASCPTTDNGDRNVKAKIKDKDGGETEYTASVTINNLAPTAIFAATGPIDEGSSSTLSFASPSDPGTADTDAGFYYSFACDGLDSSLASSYDEAGTASMASCKFNDNSDHTVL